MGSFSGVAGVPRCYKNAKCHLSETRREQIHSIQAVLDVAGLVWAAEQGPTSFPILFPRTNPFPGCSGSSTTQLTYAASINYSCRLSCTEILVSVQPRCQDSGCRQDPGSSLQFLPLTEPGWAMRLFSTGLETRCNAQKPQEQFKQTHLATITINILKLHRDMSV